MPSNSKQKASIHEAATAESSSGGEPRAFLPARRIESSNSESTTFEPEGILDFEQEAWDWLGLRGALDHTRLLEECKFRAQKGVRDAAEVLGILDKISKIRHQHRFRWKTEPTSQARGFLSSSTPDTSRVRGTARLWALLIGNDQYPTNSLHGAVNDSNDWKTYLTETLRIPESNIKQHLDATRSTMINALYDLRDNANIKPEDHIFIAYSGHGASYDALEHSFEVDIAHRAGSIEALCPVDRGLLSPDDGFVVPDISDRQVGVLLSEIHECTGAKITVVLDCCYSGGGVREMSTHSPRRTAGLNDPKVIRAMFLSADEHPRRRSLTSVCSPTWIADSRKLYRPTLLAACQDTELAREDDGKGLFTSALLKALRKKNGRSVTCSKLITSIGALRHDQKPRFDGEDRVLFF